jgi:hypothetical protein
MANNLVVEAIDLGDIDTLEEDIVPCTGCGCTCNPTTTIIIQTGGGGGNGGGGTVIV